MMSDRKRRRKNKKNKMMMMREKEEKRRIYIPLPHFSTTDFTKLMTSSSFETSTFRKMAFPSPCSSSISFKVCSPSLSDTSTMTTFAPLLAKTFAIVLPIAPPAPDEPKKMLMKNKKEMRREMGRSERRRSFPLYQ
jgi:hypothetical protein